MAKKNSLPVSLKNIRCEFITYDLVYTTDLAGKQMEAKYRIVFTGYDAELEKWRYYLQGLNEGRAPVYLKTGLEGYPGLQVAKGILINYLNSQR